MTQCNTIEVTGGCGSMPTSGPCGSSGIVELVGGVSELPDFRGFDPQPGRSLSRLQHVRFDVTDDTGLFTMVFVTATFPDGSCECVWDGQAFTSRYLAGSSRVAIQCGYRFTLRRAGGWNLTPLRVDATAIDADGNVNRMRNAFS